jgi:GSH-dependent disulfide-bond oxidoreductase
MIDLYTWGTPNGRKVSIMLEELGLPYTIHKVDIGKGDQFKPHYIAINPNSKIPSIVDSDGPKGGPFTLFESGAILIYLAEKSGGRFYSADAESRHVIHQWLMFQMGGVGPMFGQAHHFMRHPTEKNLYGIKRYGDEAKRLYGVMNRRLGEAAYLAGDDYTIADIATYPWVARHEWHQVDLAAFPNVKRWFDTIGSRPAVPRGMAVPG